VGGPPFVAGRERSAIAIADAPFLASPLLPTMEIDEHHVIVPLTTPDALIDEGLALGHCLGRYALSCAFGRSYAVSIRTGGGYRLSSAVLWLSNELKIEILDHRAARNYTPDPRQTAALNAFIADVYATVGVQVRWEQARHERAVAYGEDGPETRSNYQFHFTPAREWIFKAYYSPMLPRISEAMTRDARLNSTGIGKLAERMAQDFAATVARVAA
jgi:hypothetical protein